MVKKWKSLLHKISCAYGKQWVNADSLNTLNTCASRLTLISHRLRLYITDTGALVSHRLRQTESLTKTTQNCQELECWRGKTNAFYFAALVIGQNFIFIHTLGIIIKSQFSIYKIKTLAKLGKTNLVEHSEAPIALVQLIETLRQLVAH